MDDNAPRWVDTALAYVGLVRRSQIAQLCALTQEDQVRTSLDHILNVYHVRSALNQWNPPDTRGH